MHASGSRIAQLRALPTKDHTEFFRAGTWALLSTMDHHPHSQVCQLLHVESTSEEAQYSSLICVCLRVAPSPKCPTKGAPIGCAGFSPRPNMQRRICNQLFLRGIQGSCSSWPARVRWAAFSHFFTCLRVLISSSLLLIDFFSRCIFTSLFCFKRVSILSSHNLSCVLRMCDSLSSDLLCSASC